MWTPFSKLRILLVEDDPDMFPLVRQYLEEELRGQFEIYWADTYRVGLEKLLSENYDIAIVDHYLDERSGVQLIRVLREKGKDIPCIVLTSSPDKKTIVEALKAGASDYLEKTELTPLLLSKSVQYVWQKSLWERKNQIQERLISLGRLVAGIAHDFNNILQSILLCAQLLQLNEDLPDSVRKDIRLIQKQVVRASEMINQILDFTRCEETPMEFLSLKKVIEETLQFLRRAIPENIKIRVNIQTDKDLIFGDFNKCQQILTNLLLNAKDAMEGRAGMITITLYRRCYESNFPLFGLPVGSWLVLEVQDTGKGIPKEILPSIFDPFFTTKPEGQGTGIGLSQVYSFVKQHQGFIDVQSTVGVGTTFTLYFPAVAEEEEEARSSVPSTNYRMIPRGKGERILIVEDDERLRETLERMLRSLGYEVTALENGKNALKIFQSMPVSLVITDLTMPELGGEDFIHLLSEQEKKVPILVLTGYALSQRVLQSLEKCVWKLLYKPVKLKTLAELVREILDSSSSKI